MQTGGYITGADYANAVRIAAANLLKHEDEVNNLNVFPIPDGDTGSNMWMTMRGGAEAAAAVAAEDTIADASRRIANGMLLAARGNSGVILSQLFDGIAKGLEGVEAADGEQLENAINAGVKRAYHAVLVPTEGTILTVARCAAEYAAKNQSGSVNTYLGNYIEEAKRTLARTREMLPVLKRAGVVDSGGAGLVYIMEGIYRSFTGDSGDFDDDIKPDVQEKSNDIDISLFTEDSVLEFGYCTELLLRLQRAKTDPEEFSVNTITDFLTTVGDSVVAFKMDSIVKIHVHTMIPDKVLSFCQQFGEFLTVKIENMSLQHNNSSFAEEAEEESERKRYGVVAVCTGAGVKEMFTERGADLIVEGGQSMNPSTEDFIAAFKKVNADTIIVLPNNGNVILTAQQAAKLFEGSEVRVIESKTIGDGYAALAMMNPDIEDSDELVGELVDAMQGVITAEIAPCIRDTKMSGMELHIGDYLGVTGKDLIASAPDKPTTVKKTLEGIGMNHYDICIIVKGKDADMDETDKLAEELGEEYPGKEFFVIDGMQEVYNYILIVQ